MEGKGKKHKKGFKIPEDYFQSFEASLFSKISEEHLPNNPGFKVPESYFSELEDQLVQKIHSAQNTPKVISIFSKRNLTIVAVAASVVLLITLVNKSSSKLDSFETLDLTSITSYIDEGNVEINSYDIGAMLTEEDFVIGTLDLQITLDDSIEEYLLETITENTLLIE
jgi:hypothetical protein